MTRLRMLPGEDPVARDCRSPAHTKPPVHGQAYGPDRVGRNVCTASTSLPSVDHLEIEQRLRDLVAAFPGPGRAEMLRVLTIRDDAERVREIGELHRSGILPATAALLIDAEEDPALRAVLVGMLREADR